MPHTLLRAEAWREYPSRDFATWFNQLEGLRSPVVIGTRSAAGVDNAAVFNSLTHVGARPPHLGFVMRPLTVERHTYDNLKASGFYTANHLPREYVERAHATSGKYPAGVSEFDACGLTPLPTAEGAPYVAEASVSMLLEFVEEHFVAANDTVFIVGAVREIRLPPGAAFGVERVDWSALGGTPVSGLYEYYDVSHATRLGYVSVPKATH